MKLHHNRPVHLLNADLHSHSHCSDGTLSPSALARRASGNGVELWALTDHDETSGLAEAAQAADLVGPFALQVHGASGFMRDYPVEKYMRELKTLSLMLGGIDAARADGVPRPVSGAGTGHHHAFLLSAPAVAAEGTA